jgi:hypothetical protein
MRRHRETESRRRHGIFEPVQFLSPAQSPVTPLQKHHGQFIVPEIRVPSKVPVMLDGEAGVLFAEYENLPFSIGRLTV